MNVIGRRMGKRSSKVMAVSSDLPALLFLEHSMPECILLKSLLFFAASVTAVGAGLDRLLEVPAHSGVRLDDPGDRFSHAAGHVDASALGGRPHFAKPA